MGFSKSERRRARFLKPNGSPKYIHAYDNGGETADRYTVTFTQRRDGTHPSLCMSTYPYYPQGVHSFDSNAAPIDYPRYSHLGKRIRFEDLPEQCRRTVLTNYEYLWDLTSDERKVFEALERK